MTTSRLGRVMAQDPTPDERARESIYGTTEEAEAAVGAGLRSRRRSFETCNSPHPTRTERRRGIVHFLTCDRPYGHKVQHRAKTTAGYVWWS